MKTLGGRPLDFGVGLCYGFGLHAGRLARMGGRRCLSMLAFVRWALFARSLLACDACRSGAGSRHIFGLAWLLRGRPALGCIALLR
jgi:hypothetical protein